ncbi:hypothetical protein ACJIZ3_006065 [Penstemon smallii]|uniref:Acid phosphatase n=1 Tax=Penstemon smallii TaxID=265156 RepID=A0ABD3S6N2_9LAMI
MSTYGHDMEREYSTHSLPSRRGSEMGSHYSTDAGIYMSSFAATVFLSGLVIVGVSLLSLLFALTVMLRSCQSGSSEGPEMYMSTNNYYYCRNFALHAELNSLGADSFPAICKDFITRYVKEGHYRRDLNITVGIVEDFFSSLKPQNDGRDIVLMDVDDLLVSDTLSTNHLIHRVDEDALHDSGKDEEYLKHIFVMKLYLKLQSGQWPLILVSRKPEKLRNATINCLTSIGCHGWSSLIMRMENEMEMDFQQFLSRQRSTLEREGFRVIASISSQMDALRGPSLGNRIFKLPNPVFMHSSVEIENQLQKRMLRQENR